jgi:uncharacterized protein YecE (DUF72 family)
MGNRCDVRCGPAGWSHPHWNACVYPRPRRRGFHELEYLSDFFQTIEIDATFYRPLRPEIARLWLGMVSHNPDFIFTAKLHRRFTHDRVLDPVEVATFKEGLWPLLRAGRLGCLLMQFPWSYRFTEENRDFLIKLRRTFHEFPLVVEMRHDSWMYDEALGVFIDYRLGFCNIDQPRHTRAMPPTGFVTSRIGYVRLHGRTRPEWRHEWSDRPMPANGGNQYLYSPAELEEWSRRIESIRAQAGTAFVIANNDAGGKSLVNALQLQAMLGESRGVAPPALLRRYPAELGEFAHGFSVQEDLFSSADVCEDVRSVA